MASINGITVKSVKTFLGHEGEPCAQGNLYLGTKKIAFWSQDPRGGIEDRFPGMVFRPVIILPYEKGSFYQKLLDESEKEYRDTVAAALQKCKRLKNALLQYHSDGNKSLKRAHISMIRSGDTFLVNGEEYTAAGDSHYNVDEDAWVVYDTDGNSFFEEDIEFKLEG